MWNREQMKMTVFFQMEKYTSPEALRPNGMAVAAAPQRPSHGRRGPTGLALIFLSAPVCTAGMPLQPITLKEHVHLYATPPNK